MTPCSWIILDLGLSDKPGLDLHPEAIGVAFDVDRCGVVQDPVQDGRGDHGIAEDLVPLREAPLRGQDQGALLYLLETSWKNRCAPCRSIGM
jgi:hypothetical protein